ncbi:HNH endonuclease [Rhodococcus globerulus]|uniref:HNH endonuclease n=1 Tax=Rhodococcus globerulus TaxID=33008 RepID=UPI000AD5FDCB|nr:HNH endonuclease [Rhodococcus globerulus]
MARPPTSITTRTWMNAQVRVLNATYEDFDLVPAARAVVLLVEDLALTLVEHSPRFVVRSQYVAIPLPRTIQLFEYVHTPPRPTIDDDTRASFAGVLARDHYRCAYCGAAGATTVDHVYPRSRGGNNSWSNLVACCLTCNNVKSDQTPEESGMPLLWVPRTPRTDRKRQHTIWRELTPHL